MYPWAGTKKALHYCSVAATPAPGRVPAQQPLVPSFTQVVGYAENFSPFPYAAAEAHGAIGSDTQALSHSYLF